MTLDKFRQMAFAVLLRAAATVWLTARDTPVLAPGSEARYIEAGPWQRDRIPGGARGESIRAGGIRNTARHSLTGEDRRCRSSRTPRLRFRTSSTRVASRYVVNRTSSRIPVTAPIRVFYAGAGGPGRQHRLSGRQQRAPVARVDRGWETNTPTILSRTASGSDARWRGHRDAVWIRSPGSSADVHRQPDALARVERPSLGPAFSQLIPSLRRPPTGETALQLVAMGHDVDLAC